MNARNKLTKEPIKKIGENIENIRKLLLGIVVGEDSDANLTREVLEGRVSGFRKETEHLKDLFEVLRNANIIHELLDMIDDSNQELFLKLLFAKPNKMETLLMYGDDMLQLIKCVQDKNTLLGNLLQITDKIRFIDRTGFAEYDSVDSIVCLETIEKTKPSVLIRCLGYLEFPESDRPHLNSPDILRSFVAELQNDAAIQNGLEFLLGGVGGSYALNPMDYLNHHIYDKEINQVDRTRMENLTTYLKNNQQDGGKKIIDILHSYDSTLKSKDRYNKIDELILSSDAVVELRNRKKQADERLSTMLFGNK